MAITKKSTKLCSVLNDRHKALYTCKLHRNDYIQNSNAVKLKCSKDRKKSSVSFIFWQGHHNHVLLISSLLSPFTKQTTILIHSLSWKL